MNPPHFEKRSEIYLDLLRRVPDRCLGDYFREGCGNCCNLPGEWMARLTVERSSSWSQRAVDRINVETDQRRAFREPTSRAASEMPLQKKAKGHPGVNIALTFDFL